MNTKGILWILGAVAGILILFKLLFKRKTKEERELEKQETLIEIEKKKQELEKKKTETELKKAEQKKKLFVEKFDNSFENPLSDNYKYKGKAITNKELRDLSFNITKELLKIDPDEQKINTYFSLYPNKDTIYLYRLTMLKTNPKYNWTTLLARTYKGTTDPFNDLYDLYDTISKKP